MNAIYLEKGNVTLLLSRPFFLWPLLFENLGVLQYNKKKRQRRRLDEKRRKNCDFTRDYPNKISEWKRRRSSSLFE
ncbi:hypothetical protein EFL25_03190 [Enterococcus faecium]|nr:hypothetical protein CTI32_05990 [Enterococcus faecium]EGP5229468.1 hypothetical protein [Enterococcus faecium]EGP5277089.1 hypothetical protein [Enterococcus faecium]EGP5399665.1 hypothetical protein [Enterococcus faecium]EGP5423070.1 hypothetical protein [Enterococcus faecium]